MADPDGAQAYAREDAVPEEGTRGHHQAGQSASAMVEPDVRRVEVLRGAAHRVACPSAAVGLHDSAEVRRDHQALAEGGGWARVQGPGHAAKPE